MKYAARHLRSQPQSHEAHPATTEPHPAGHSPGNLVVLQLQRLIGNRRTQEVLQKAVQRQATDPFANERPEDKKRRLDAIKEIHQAIERVTMVIGGGYLYEFEHVIEGGIDQSLAPGLKDDSTQYHETFEQRETRLRTLVAALIHLLTRLESQPTPAEEFTPGNGQTLFERTDLYDRVYLVVASLEEGSDPKEHIYDGLGIFRIMLTHIQKQQGQSLFDVLLNLDAIKHAPVITRRVPRGRISAGTATGIYIAVPDPVNHPMVYQRVTSRPLTPGIILDVWHDDMGFYYRYKKQRHYLPERP